MSIPEHAAQAVNSTVEALRSTPVLLSVLIFNVALMVFTGWSTYHQGQQWQKIFELTYQCVRPEQR